MALWLYPNFFSWGEKIAWDHEECFLQHTWSSQLIISFKLCMSLNQVIALPLGQFKCPSICNLRIFRHQDCWAIFSQLWLMSHISCRAGKLNPLHGLLIVKYTALGKLFLDDSSLNHKSLCLYIGKETASSPTELAAMDHPKVVNSAYFSPVTGRKILTTCIDNRIRYVRMNWSQTCLFFLPSSAKGRSSLV